jgi:hypothetical protein
MDTMIFKWFRSPEHKTLCSLVLYCRVCLLMCYNELLLVLETCPISVTIQSFYSSRLNSYRERPKARQVTLGWLAVVILYRNKDINGYM